MKRKSLRLVFRAVNFVKYSLPGVKALNFQTILMGWQKMLEICYLIHEKRMANFSQQLRSAQSRLYMFLRSIRTKQRCLSYHKPMISNGVPESFIKPILYVDNYSYSKLSINPRFFIHGRSVVLSTNCCFLKQTKTTKKPPKIVKFTN